jgi:hypothetical protein
MDRLKYWIGIVMMAISIIWMVSIVFSGKQYDFINGFGLAAIIAFNLIGGMLLMLDNDKTTF